MTLNYTKVPLFFRAWSRPAKLNRFQQPATTGPNAPFLDISVNPPATTSATQKYVEYANARVLDGLRFKFGT